MLQLDPHPTVFDLRLVEDLLDIVDGTAGHIPRAELLPVLDDFARYLE